MATSGSEDLVTHHVMGAYIFQPQEANAVERAQPHTHLINSPPDLLVKGCMTKDIVAYIAVSRAP